METQPGEVREVAPGVHHVTGTRVSSYVLIDQGEVTLVDTGYPGDTDRLITGDGLVTLDVLSLETGPRLLPRPFNHHQPTTVASRNALREIDAEVVLPGHGAPFHGTPAEAVDLAVARLV